MQYSWQRTMNTKQAAHKIALSAVSTFFGQVVQKIGLELCLLLSSIRIPLLSSHSFNSIVTQIL